jgi:DNA-binding response OmpR family regulator
MEILIAEYDKALAKFLAHGFEADGHRVQLAHGGMEAKEMLRREVPSLTILDLNLPVEDGEQLLKEIRLLTDLSVLVLSSSPDLESRIRCLDLGADDFIPKPFSHHEFRARCRAHLRCRPQPKYKLQAGNLEMDRLDHTVRRGILPIDLTNTEFNLLEHLMLNRGQCVSRLDLLASVWKSGCGLGTNIVDVYINYLRCKLMDPRPGQLIKTVRGRGYCIPTEFDLARGF